MSRRLGLPRLSLVGVSVLLLIYVVRLIGHVPLGPLDRVADDWLYTVVELAGFGLVAARAVADRRLRPAWSALAAYALLWCVGDLGWTLHFDGVAEPPFPNWTDAAYLASYPFAYVGMVLLLRARLGAARASQWLDGLVGGLAMAALCAALFLGPVISAAGGGSAAVAVTLAYPVLDLLLLCVVGVAFGAAGWRPGPLWIALGGALAVSAVGDAAYSWQEAVGTYSGSSLVNASWPLSMTLLATAAVTRSEGRLSADEADDLFAVPALCAVAALGILTWSQFHHVAVAATMTAIATLAVAGIRAWLTHRENIILLRRSRRDALEDGLTGLPNRRRLMSDLETALARADNYVATLVFFDLDGFKSYNDAFGHGAGDALLARLAAQLVDQLDGAARAYRLGGDEFCVLFDGARAREDLRVLAAARALTDSGEGFDIGSSYGLVTLPLEASSASVALQLADERMYTHKGSRRGSPGAQGRDLLLQVLREREPELGEHLDDVGALATAVGRELGLDVQALEEIARAAELHDVGKVAVPERILHKPGPLDDAEWAIMRQHTVVGERILLAAPALRPVARLVRASHERWDGGGYPDGLAGERIPLGSRIIAVCDAFDAMRQDRPYAPGMPEAEAMAELRRCAGTQFDPRVVEAFASALALGAANELRVA